MRNVKHFWIVLGLSAIALLAACESSVDDQSLPTVMVLPSLTPSETASITPLPSATHTPAATETATPTLTPTATATTTNTPTLTRTPTPTRTLFPSPTVTSSQTVTPAQSSTAAFPTITEFTTSSTDVAGGAQITLRWTASGDSARIEQQDANGLVQTTTDVPVSGELNVTVPNTQAGRLFYRLVVLRGAQEVTQTLEIRIQVQCPINWFFGSEFVTNENVGCPPAASQQVVGSYQSFEHGFMLNLNLDGQNIIYAVVRSPGKNAQYFNDQYGYSNNGWDNTTQHCTGIPPANTMLPQNQFGWMACTQLALGGFWIDGTGYATASIDLNPRTVQRANDGSLFVDAPDGTVYRLNPLPGGAITGTWKRIK